MSLDVESCCKKPICWIFVYTDGEVYSICEDHFYSRAHRTSVKNVVNFQTRAKYEPAMLFQEHPLADISNQEIPHV